MNVLLYTAGDLAGAGLFEIMPKVLKETVTAIAFDVYEDEQSFIRIAMACVENKTATIYHSSLSKAVLETMQANPEISEQLVSSWSLPLLQLTQHSANV